MRQRHDRPTAEVRLRAGRFHFTPKHFTIIMFGTYLKKTMVLAQITGTQ
jgi:hypothetical protein